MEPLEGWFWTLGIGNIPMLNLSSSLSFIRTPNTSITLRSRSPTCHERKVHSSRMDILDANGYLDRGEGSDPVTGA